ncbi:MAG TPA: YceH family protein [Lacunisphaera sp.]|nr:YceH family protein [Lacunisphaera sp.]
MDPTAPAATPAEAPAPLSALEARVLGCLIEKELATPDAYPLTLNALVNACNQRNNRDPVMEVGAREVEAALDQLRYKHLAAIFSGADARVPKFKQKLDAVHPMSAAARALLGELLLRGPQTLAALRANAERLHAMPPAPEFESLFAELTDRPSGALVRQLPRQPGQKEARWAQLLTGEPAVAMAAAGPAAEPLKVALALPPEAERRLGALEAEVAQLKAELARLRSSLGEG